MKRRTATKGEEFGDLTVIGPAAPQCGKTRVFLRCVCGKVVERFISALHKPSMNRMSCGCGRKKYGGRKRAQEKTYEKNGSFNPVAQKFYLGML